MAVVLTAVALAPMLAVIAARAGRTYFPVQDFAVIDVRVRDVWSTDAPLIGPWSREGWGHPGPLFYWLLGVPSLLTGGSTWSLIVGGALLQGTAIVAATKLAWDRGRLALVVLVLGILTLESSAVGAWGVIMPWNPHVALPFFTVLVLLAWSVSLGELRRLPWLALTSTFLVQTHIGYLPLVVVSVIFALGGAAPRCRARAGECRRYLVVSTLITATLWAPAVVDQVVGVGNLSRIGRFFTSSQQEPTGLRTGAGLLAAEFRIPPPWLGGHDSVDRFTGAVQPASLGWLAVPCLLLALTVVVVTRARQPCDPRPRRHLTLLVALAAVTTVVAIGQVRGTLFAYLFPWRITVALLIMGAAIWSLTPWIEETRYARRLVGTVLLTSICISSGLLTYRTATYPEELDYVFEFTPVARSLVRQLEPRARHQDRVLLRQVGSGQLGLHSIMLNELDRADVDVRVDPGLAFQFGQHRTATPDDVSSVWLVIEQGWLLSRISALEGTEVLARTEPLPRSAERDLARLQRRLRWQLEGAGRPDLVRLLDSPLLAFAVEDQARIDQRAAEVVAAYNERALASAPCRCAVVKVDRDAPVLDDRRAMRGL